MLWISRSGQIEALEKSGRSPGKTNTNGRELMKAFLMHVKAFGRFCMVLSIVVSATSVAAERARAGVPSDKLTLGYTTVGAILTPVWIPAEMGIFQKYGLDVDMKFITTGPVVVSSLIAGEIGVAAASGEPIVSGILGGADLTIM